MSVLPFDSPDKAIQPTNQFIFLTGTEDFTIRKTAAAKIARARGQRILVSHGAKYMVPVNIIQAAWLVLNARNNGTGITVA